MLKQLTVSEKAALCPVHELEQLIGAYNKELLSLRNLLNDEMGAITEDSYTVRRILHRGITALDELAEIIEEKRKALWPVEQMKAQSDG